MHSLLITDPDDAVRALDEGALVALPTETVYGLAARADSPIAVKRIYQVKDRPPDHPVIVHVADAAQAEEWALEIPSWIRPVIDQCWPGPLTLITRRDHRRVGDYLTGGQDTVGLRVPGHPVALQILRRLGTAVAAPSANRFGHVSPTTAQHVLDELGPYLDPDRDRIFDGGDCEVGLESTILDVTGDQPRLLRPGAVAATDIEELTGRPVLDDAPVGTRAPGMLTAHYAPAARVVLSTAPEACSVIERLLTEYPGEPIGAIALSLVGLPQGERVKVLLSCATDVELAHGLYQALRAADDNRLAVVVAVLPPDEGVGRAVRDRLQKAAVGRRESPS